MSKIYEFFSFGKLSAVKYRVLTILLFIGLYFLVSEFTQEDFTKSGVASVASFILLMILCIKNPKSSISDGINIIAMLIEVTILSLAKNNYLEGDWGLVVVALVIEAFVITYTYSELKAKGFIKTK